MNRERADAYLKAFKSSAEYRKSSFAYSLTKHNKRAILADQDSKNRYYTLTYPDGMPGHEIHERLDVVLNSDGHWAESRQLLSYSKSEPPYRAFVDLRTGDMSVHIEATRRSPDEDGHGYELWVNEVEKVSLKLGHVALGKNSFALFKDIGRSDSHVGSPNCVALVTESYKGGFRFFVYDDGQVKENYYSHSKVFNIDELQTLESSYYPPHQLFIHSPENDLMIIELSDLSAGKVYSSTFPMPLSIDYPDWFNYLMSEGREWRKFLRHARLSLTRGDFHPREL